MLTQGQVVNSIPSSRSSGNPNMEQLWLGELAVSEVMPRYSALAKSGKINTGRGALQTLSVAGTAMTGLILWNASSTVDLHVLKVSGDVAVTSASLTGIALGFGTGQVVSPTGTTNGIRSNNYVAATGNVSLAGLYTGATMTFAPVAQFDLQHNTAAISTTGEDSGFLIDFEGSIVIPPTSYVAFIALGAASAASAVNLSIMWAELPV